MPAMDPRAHGLVHRAILTGELVRPEVCSQCGKPPNGKGKIHAHHEDYGKPLEVEWLCPKCHRQRPSGIGGKTGKAASWVMTRVPPEMVPRIDALRGDVPRERWVRRRLEEVLDDLEAKERRVG